MQSLSLRIISSPRISSRSLSITSCLEKNVAGRYKVTLKHNKPLTYEMSQKPHEIAHTKMWTSMNTSSFTDFGKLTSQVTLEDVFIRRFLTGTWHDLFVQEILIKRQANLIRIAGIVQRSLPSRKMYFLIGYSEELLGHWLQCPVRLELQTVDSREDVVFKYV